MSFFEKFFRNSFWNFFWNCSWSLVGNHCGSSFGNSSKNSIENSSKSCLGNFTNNFIKISSTYAFRNSSRNSGITPEVSFQILTKILLAIPPLVSSRTSPWVLWRSPYGTCSILFSGVASGSPSGVRSRNPQEATSRISPRFSRSFLWQWPRLPLGIPAQIILQILGDFCFSKIHERVSSFGNSTTVSTKNFSKSIFDFFKDFFF